MAVRPAERPGTTTRHRLASPRHRPPVAVRAFAGLLAMATLVVNVALLLSDRAPGALKRVFGDAARRLWDRVDAGERAGIPAERVPESDVLVHIAIWAIAVTLVGVAVWTWRGLAIGALALLTCSVVLELAQGRYSSTRIVERGDAIANATGVALGVAVTAGCYLLWSGVGALRATSRDRAG